MNRPPEPQSPNAGESSPDQDPKDDSDLSRLLSPRIQHLYRDRPQDLGPLLSSFVAHGDKSLDDLDQRVNALDLKGMAVTLHSLKGSCQVLGLKTMAKLCESLESLAAAGLIDGCRPLMRQLQQELDRVRRLLARL